MPRKYELTWRPRECRWQKYYRGKYYYFPFGEAKTDRAGYLKALAAWKEKKAEVDATPVVVEPVYERTDEYYESPKDKLLTHIQTCLDEYRDSPWAGKLDDVAMGLNSLMALERKTDGDHNFRTLPAIEALEEIKLDDEGFATFPESLAKRFSPTPEQPAVEPSKTVGGNVERYVIHRRELATNGQIHIGRYESERHCMNNFKKHVGENFALADINAQTLRNYHSYLLGEMKAEKISGPYAKLRFGTTKAFIKFCYEDGLLPLPINFLNKFRFPISRKPIPTFTIEEVQTILNASPEKTKLYLLMMLNFGIQQEDISKLNPNQINWKKKVLEYRRFKTGQYEGVPDVTYPIWAETLELLKKFGHKDGNLLLTNEDGKPLVTNKLAEEKGKHIDNIRSAFSRVVRKVGIKKPLKLIRKTSSSVIGGHPEFGKFAQFFLGNSGRTIADKHYIQPNQEQFDRAVAWLREQILETAEKPLVVKE